MHDSTALDAAAEAVGAELVIVVPTDTVYGLAALPSSAAAVEQLYVLKSRPESMPIAMLIASPAQARDLAVSVSPAAQRLMDAFWPGPLTIVLANTGRDDRRSSMSRSRIHAGAHRPHRSARSDEREPPRVADAGRGARRRHRVGG